MSATLPTRLRLSVAMIVRNAEKTLPETIQSISSIADEIVILDTGSTDATRQAAQHDKLLWHEAAWTDDFSAARNLCLSHAEGDWILWLDAGESLSAEAAEKLRRFIDEKAESSQAYMMLIQVPPAKNEVSGEQIGRIRLFPKHSGIRFSGRVCEDAIDSLTEVGIEIAALPIAIQRGEREHEQLNKTQKARRNILLADLQIKEQGPLATLLICLGEAMVALGDKPRAAEFFKAALAKAENGSTELLEAYYGLLTSIEDGGAEEAVQAQLEIALKALEIFPLDTQLLCAMGGYLQILGRFDLAVRSYQTAFQFGQINPNTWHLDRMTEIVAVCYSLSLQLQNQDQEAREVLEKVLEKESRSERLRRCLLDLHIKHGRRDEAFEQLDLLLPSSPGREAFRSAIRGACLASQKNWIPARAYLEAAYNQKCREIPCLRWYSVSLLASGEKNLAKAVLQQWQEIDPDCAEPKNYLQAISPESPADDIAASETAGEALTGQKPATPDPSSTSAPRQVRVDEAQKDVIPLAPLPETLPGSPIHTRSSQETP